MQVTFVTIFDSWRIGSNYLNLSTQEVYIKNNSADILITEIPALFKYKLEVRLMLLYFFYKFRERFFSFTFLVF